MKAKASSQKKKCATPERNGQEWQQLYDQVRKERNRLRKELTTAKEERDYFRKVVGTLMAKEFPEFDEEEVLARNAPRGRAIVCGIDRGGGSRVR